MNSVLFMVCPTDQLETIISCHFRGCCFFYTALGNNFEFDDYTIEQIRFLILANSIRRIVFISCNDNKIIMDGIGEQKYCSISGLGKLYAQLKKQTDCNLFVEGRKDRLQRIISEHLKSQIRTLDEKLKGCEGIKINGLTYDRNRRTFQHLLHPMFYEASLCLN